jgi:hypothetical protein
VSGVDNDKADYMIDLMTFTTFLKVELHIEEVEETQKVGMSHHFCKKRKKM